MRAAAGSEPTHTAHGSCPAVRPSLGTTEPLSPLVVCFICKLLARHSRGAQRPCLRRVPGDTGAAAVPRDVPRLGGEGGTKGRAEMSPESSPPSGPRGPCTGEPSTLPWPWGHRGHGAEAGPCQAEEAPNPCGLPGKPQPQGRWGRAGSLGASTRCWEPWGAGACPGSPQTTQKTEGRSRLTHGRALGAEISRPAAALTSLPQPVPAALAWGSASSLRAKAPGPGVGQEEEGGRKPPAPCAAITGTRESPSQTLAVPLHPPRRQRAAQRRAGQVRGSGWPGRALTPAPGQGTRPGARPQLLVSRGSQAAGCSPAPATASAGGASHIRTQLMAGIVL